MTVVCIFHHLKNCYQCLYGYYNYFYWRNVKKNCHVFELESHFLTLHPQYYEGNINRLIASGCHLSLWHLPKHTPCAWGINQPCIPRKCLRCHFVSMVSALTRSATLAASPRLNAACRQAQQIIVIPCFMQSSCLFLSPRDSSCFALLCSSSRVKVTGPERLGRW